MSPKPLLNLKLFGGKGIVLAMLVRGYPNGIAMEDILDRYFRDYDGGLYPERVIRNIIGELRLAIAPHGWTIPRGTGGRCGPGEYRLERIEGQG